MIIARSKKPDGGELLLLGLSRENVQRLTDGQPIRLTRKTHGDGIPDKWTIGIMFGETERDMAELLRQEGLITPETKTYVDPRL
jgi:hypothetical protein